MKQIYFAISNHGRWGRSRNLRIALDNAGLTKQPKKKSDVQVHLAILILKQEATDEEVDNIMSCYSVNDMGGINFYDEPRKAGPELDTWKVDKEMTKRLIVGWVNDTTSFIIK